LSTAKRGRVPPAMAAICPACGEDMEESKTCLADPVKLVDEIYERIAYGSEEEDWGTESGDPCHDCGVAPGGSHHFFCDVERCPRFLLRCGAMPSLRRAVLLL